MTAPFRLKEVREAHGLSSTDLAKRLGVDRSVITHWEKGDKFPNYENLYRLSKALGCPLDSFVHPPGQGYNKNRDEILSLIKEMIDDDTIDLIRQELNKRASLYAGYIAQVLYDET